MDMRKFITRRVVKTYRTGVKHPAFKSKRNLQLVKDRYPNWPATGSRGLTIDEIAEKYGITRSRIYSIIKVMKLEEFGYA